LLQIKLVILVLGKISQSDWKPAGPTSFKEMSRYYKEPPFFKLSANKMMPSSPIIFPLRFRASNVVFYEIPFAIHLQPCIESSLNSKFNFYKTFEFLSNFAIGFPTSLFKKFFASES